MSETEINKRALLVVQSYVGPEEDYLDHLNLVLDKFFKNDKKTATKPPNQQNLSKP